jgi:hypothetical protein
MYKFIKRNQKKVLAGFSALLMIVFFIPNQMKNGHGVTRRAVGTVGKQPVYADEMAQATADWRLLTRVEADLPYLSDLYGSSARPWQLREAPYVLKLGPALAGEIEGHPDLYFLLQREAADRGIAVSNDQVENVLTNDLFIPGANPPQHPTPDIIGENTYRALHDAVARFLPVAILHDQTVQSVTVTQPMWDHAVADEFQLVKLAIADFPAGEFAKTAAAPTAQQLQDQFDKFKNAVAGQTPTKENPFGFGYELPQRIKLQYLTIPRQQVQQAVLASRSAYDWEVDARVYYYAHQADFVRPAPPTPTTQPATTQSARASTTAPTAGPTTAPALAETPTSQPTTRPFTEVKTEIMDKVLADPTAALEQKIQSAIADRLAADFADHSLTPTPSPATTEPTSGFASKNYLDTIALDIQKQFGVLPQVTQIGQWTDREAASRLEGIGSSNAADKLFTDYAFGQAPEPTSPPTTATSLLQGPPLLEPSAPLKDSSDNVYFFRVTARDPAHAPPLSQQMAQVQADYRLSAGYDAAVKAAKKLLENAQTKRLVAAAKADNRPVITPFPFQPGDFITGYQLKSDSQSELGRKAEELLTQASSQNPHPLAVVELPADQKVAAIQLLGVVSHIPSDQMYLLELTRTRLEAQRLREQVSHDFFNYDAVKARLDYVPTEAEKNENG